MSKIDEALNKIASGRYDLEEYEDVIVNALIHARQSDKRKHYSSEWTCVEHNTPPLQKKVLLCTDKGEVLIGSLVACWGSHDNWHYKWSCYTKTPVAWMPLPDVYDKREQGGDF